jgi:KDO2-lipid IV(A) lauroyltransferase
MAQHSALTNYAQYTAARTAALLLGLFPINANLRTARGAGRLIYALDRKHRKRALENLRASFPEKRERELDDIARQSMEHFIELVMDVLFTPRLIHAETWHRYVHLDALTDSLKLLLRTREKDGGAIMLTGHYGNWEVLGYTLATLGFETYSIARPIDNPLIDEWVLGVRQRKGQVILSKRGVTTTAQEVLESRGVLGFIADQNAGPKGMFVPFFGRMASTYKSIGLLAIQYRVPVVIGYARRRGGRFEFDIGVQDIIWPADWEAVRTAGGDELRYVTERYTKAIEDFVRADPTQYLWIHRRWKTRPKGEAPGMLGTG